MLHAKINISDVTPASDDRRLGTDRVAIGLPSTVRAGDLNPRDVVVEDLSSSGFRFRSDQPLAIGAMLHVGLVGGGMAQARVVRTDDDQHGCKFVRPLSDEQLREAFSPATVLTGVFPERYATPVIAYEEEKWPGAVRLSVMLGGSALCWAALYQIGTALFR